MEIKELQKNWDKLGKVDPLWAILSVPDKKDGKWDIEEFFATGEKAIAHVISDIDSLGLKIQRRKALDFGCGVGRLTQALCKYFETCYGVDIASSMLELANEYNKFGSRCRYVLNENNNLMAFDDNSFDLIISFLVLQHMRPEYSKRYIKEFLRVLAPGGLLIFQVPSELSPEYLKSRGGPNLLGKIRSFGASLLKKGAPAEGREAGEESPRIEMYGVLKKEVLDIIHEGGGRVIEARENRSAGFEWLSFNYYITK